MSLNPVSEAYSQSFSSSTTVRLLLLVARTTSEPPCFSCPVNLNQRPSHKQCCPWAGNTTCSCCVSTGSSSFSMSADIPPQQTIYVQNLYEKLRKEGQSCCSYQPFPAFLDSTETETTTTLHQTYYLLQSSERACMLSSDSLGRSWTLSA